MRTVELDIATCHEIELYFLIDEAGAFIWRMNHDMGSGRIPKEHHSAIDKDIVQVRQQQTEAVRQCSRFGVANPIDSNNRATTDYWKWYRWWDGWKKAMTNDEWNELDAALSRGLTEEDVQKYRPSETWDVPLPSSP